MEELRRAERVDRSWAYCLLRLLAGVNLFGHGAIRLLHGDRAFAEGMVKQMAETPLPAPLVSGFGHAVPFIELALGLTLIFGAFTRVALGAAMLFLCVLMFGVTLRQDWATAGSQLVYGLVFAALLAYRSTCDRGWITLLRDSSQSL